MLMRIRLRIRLVGLVGGLFVMAVRCMAVRGYVLGARAVNGDGELLCLFGHGISVFGQVGYLDISAFLAWRSGNDG